MQEKHSTLRTLAPSERIYIDFAKGSAVLASLMLDSHLSVEQAQTSLTQLIQSHPLLQSIVAPDQAQLNFVTHADKTEINLINSSDFERVYQDVQNTLLDPTKKLIHCSLAQSEASQQSYIVFLLHHCVADGTCAAEFLNDFMLIYTGQTTDADYQVPAAIETLSSAPQQSADDTRAQEQALINQLQPIRMPFKPEIELTTQPYMSTLNRSFSTQESEKLIQATKVKGCTVHGVISAAIIQASYQLASAAYQKDELTLCIKYALDIRRRLPKPLPRRQVFAAVTAYNELYELSKEQSFWQLADSTKSKVHSYLDNDGASKSAHAFSAAKSVENANVALMISNIGQSGVANKYADIVVLDAHVHATVLAPCPVITVLTFNGRIQLDFSFTQPFVPQYATTQIADRAMDILRTELVL